MLSNVGSPVHRFDQASCDVAMSVFNTLPPALVSLVERNFSALNLPRVGSDSNRAFSSVQINISDAEKESFSSSGGGTLLLWLVMSHILIASRSPLESTQRAFCDFSQRQGGQSDRSFDYGVRVGFTAWLRSWSVLLRRIWYRRSPIWGGGGQFLWSVLTWKQTSMSPFWCPADFLGHSFHRHSLFP